MASATKYPASISASGWADAGNVKVEDGNPATFPNAHCPDITATAFDFAMDVPANAVVKKVTLGVKASATATGGVEVAIDQLRLVLNGQQIEEPHLHGCGLSPSDQLAWYEDTLYPADLSGAGIGAAHVRDPSFGMVAAFYDRNGSETGSGTVSVDAVRITVEWD